MHDLKTFGHRVLGKGNDRGDAGTTEKVHDLEGRWADFLNLLTD